MNIDQSSSFTAIAHKARRGFLLLCYILQFDLYPLLMLFDQSCEWYIVFSACKIDFSDTCLSNTTVTRMDKCWVNDDTKESVKLKRTFTN